jgi:hypothetical protein
MRKPLLAMLVVVLTISACGRIRDSRLNPFNWFGRSEPVAVQTADPAADVAEDGRQLVAEVTELVLDRTAGGAIVRAVGLPPTQGFWEAELVARPIDENGVLVYDFRVFPPEEGAAVSTRQSREIVVAAFLSNIRLNSITQISVQGERNARAVRR